MPVHMASPLPLQPTLQPLLRMVEQIEFGMVGFNDAPFCGIKQSGLGREGGSQASPNTPPPNTSAWPTHIQPKPDTQGELSSDGLGSPISPAVQTRQPRADASSMIRKSRSHRLQ